MLHGAAGRLWQPLKLLANICDIRDMKMAPNGAFGFSDYPFDFKVVGEVGLEPTKA
jgi:hypothetical protein